VAQTRPADIRIDDLATPTFAPAVEQMRAGMSEMAHAIRLDEQVLLAEACRQTGLSDFGDDRFRERLRVLLGALDSEAGLSPAGRFMQWSLLVQLLRNRLLIQNVLSRHPEIHDIPIGRPIIICGLPRTGTTHLHNLMSSDPALRSLPYWEGLEPVLPDAEQPAPGESDPRVIRTQMALEFLDMALPHFKRMHEMTTQHIHEEIQLLAIDFSTMLFETMAPMPSWHAYYRSHDQTPVYEYLKTVLKVLTWLRGGVRWVLKSPQHLEQFPVLLKVFPDATFVVTHRDPVAVSASVATMIAYSSRLALANVDPVAIGRYWAARVEEMLRACVRDRELLPAAASIDVRFDEFMADDVAMVRKIYGVAGQPFTPRVEDAMRAFMVQNPRGKFGGVTYDLADFGIDRDARRAALRFYAERFAVKQER
jgi:sulfotransferase family protein